MRLARLDPDEPTDAQRRAYNTAKKATDTKAYAGSGVQRADGTFAGPWSVVVQFPEIADAWAALGEAVGGRQGISPQTREVVILTVCGHFQAVYALQAHAAVASRLGISAEHITGLCAGSRIHDLAGEQALAANLANALLRGGVVPDSIYEAVLRELGQDAVDAVVFVALYYMAICTLLNAYDVPANT